MNNTFIYINRHGDEIIFTLIDKDMLEIKTKYTPNYIRQGINTELESFSIAFIDYPGGPFLEVGSNISNYTSGYINGTISEIYQDKKTNNYILILK